MCAGPFLDRLYDGVGLGIGGVSGWLPLCVSGSATLENAAGARGSRETASLTTSPSLCHLILKSAPLPPSGGGSTTCSWWGPVPVSGLPAVSDQGLEKLGALL